MEVYIHIGTEKTGTTSVQNFFQLNRNTLAESGVCYPISPGNEKHFNLSVYCRDENIEDDLNARTNLSGINAIRQFKKELPEKLEAEIYSLKQPQKLILSSEHLSSRLSSHHELKRLKELVSSFSNKPKILIYLRRQDDFLISTYSTYVKSGGTDEFTIPKIDHEITKRYDYLPLINLWSDVFEKENIIVKTFDKNELKNQDIIVDFLHQTHIDLKESHKFPEKRNESFDASALEFLRRFNAIIPCMIDSKLNPEWLGIIEVLSRLSKENPFFSYDELKLQAFYEHFAESNKIVAKEYLNRADGNLFSERNPNKNEKTGNINFDVENLMKITTQIWKIQNAETRRLIFKNKILEAEILIRQGKLDRAEYAIKEADSFDMNKKAVDTLRKLLVDKTNTKQKSGFFRWFSL